MDITFVADTHGLHHELKLEPGTLLIHAGDITEYGTEEEVTDFLEWFALQPFTYKVFIAGNHDLFLEECTTAKIKKMLPKGVTYLNNSAANINGVKIYGTPITPYFLGMAFNAREGSDIQKYWDKIPTGIDILITHGPPKDILDGGIGCSQLHNRVLTLQPAIHCFGHAHGQQGMQLRNRIRFINAALVNNLDPMENKGHTLIGKPLLLNLKRCTILQP